jgi:hypothetical protein
VQNTFIQSRGDQLIIDKGQLTTYVAIALIVLIFIALVVIALKRRSKNFIKTVPTNLKDEA